MSEPLIDPTRPHARDYLRYTTLASIIAANLIHVATIAMFWGDWAKVAVPVIGTALLNPFNWAMSRLSARIGRSRAEPVRIATNLTYTVVAGVLLDWPLPVWLFLPFIGVFQEGIDDRPKHEPVIFQLVVWNITAISTGAPWTLSLAFSTLTLFCHFVAVQRQKLTLGLLVERVRQYDELVRIKDDLQRAHETAVVQEKLASIGMLAAGVAHEINNPMSYVTANLRCMQEEVRKRGAEPALIAELRDELLPETLQGALRVNSIVADLRRFARGESQQMADFDVNAEIAAAVRIASSQLGSGQRIEARLAPNLPMLRGSARQIGQVLLNLIVNGVQALPAEGVVCVTSETAHPGVKIAVQDTGSGLSPETLKKLFQPFFTTKGPGKGTGLGLAVAHGIVSHHGGRIEVRSTLGVGTTFAIWLPATANAEESTGVVSSGERSSNTFGEPAVGDMKSLPLSG